MKRKTGPSQPRPQAAAGQRALLPRLRAGTGRAGAPPGASRGRAWGAGEPPRLAAQVRGVRATRANNK